MLTPSPQMPDNFAEVLTSRRAQTFAGDGSALRLRETSPEVYEHLRERIIEASLDPVRDRARMLATRAMNHMSAADLIALELRTPRTPTFAQEYNPFVGQGSYNPFAPLTSGVGDSCYHHELAVPSLPVRDRGWYK